jgi:hypothetical protein
MLIMVQWQRVEILMACFVVREILNPDCSMQGQKIDRCISSHQDSNNKELLRNPTASIYLTPKST